MARRLCSAQGCHRHGFAALDAGFAGTGLAAHGADRNHQLRASVAESSFYSCRCSQRSPARRTRAGARGLHRPMSLRAGARCAWREARQDPGGAHHSVFMGFRAGAARSAPVRSLWPGRTGSAARSLRRLQLAAERGRALGVLFRVVTPRGRRHARCCVVWVEPALRGIRLRLLKSRGGRREWVTLSWSEVAFTLERS